jgi:hypothetical protein
MTEGCVTTMEDKKRLYKLMAYIIMGDGGVYKVNGRNKPITYCKFIMNHTSLEYCNFVTNIVNNITSCKIYNRKDYNIDDCDRKIQYRIESHQHPFFQHMRDRIYHNGYKSIDSHYLKMLDGESLSILYMCDGNISYKDNAISSINLNLKRLTEGDLKLFANYLKKILNIDSTINKQSKYFYIRISANSYFNFINIISPYILNDFKYKLPNEELLLKYRNRYQKDEDIV